jgi:hypothetical protein
VVLVAVAAASVYLCFELIVEPRQALQNQIREQGALQTTIRFTEVDDAGKPIDASQEFTLPGQEVYFDTLVIKFDDHFVEQADPIGGGALIVFRRIFSSTIARRRRLRHRQRRPGARSLRGAAIGQRLREGPLATLLGPCQRRAPGEGARRAGHPRRRQRNERGSA